MDGDLVTIRYPHLHPLAVELPEAGDEGGLGGGALGAAPHSHLRHVEGLLLVGAGVVLYAQLIRGRVAEVEGFKRGLRVFDPDDVAIASLLQGLTDVGIGITLSARP